ncbi:UNVERIFIED_CONTAM: hypothetical protein Sradi_6952800 [Sesamum radiatum]|uniref:Uncharacterized protein n=1 Tax=Sesamum radiatum TaxID=300843 RepID=A0AAW2JET3_SESRA
MAEVTGSLGLGQVGWRGMGLGRIWADSENWAAGCASAGLGSGSAWAGLLGSWAEMFWAGGGLLRLTLG